MGIRRWILGTLRADRFEADEVDADSVNTNHTTIAGVFNDVKRSEYRFEWDAASGAIDSWVELSSGAFLLTLRDSPTSVRWSSGTNIGDCGEAGPASVRHPPNPLSWNNERFWAARVTTEGLATNTGSIGMGRLTRDDSISDNIAFAFRDGDLVGQVDDGSRTTTTLVSDFVDGEFYLGIHWDGTDAKFYVGDFVSVDGTVTAKPSGSPDRPVYAQTLNEDGENNARIFLHHCLFVEDGR